MLVALCDEAFTARLGNVAVDRATATRDDLGNKAIGIGSKAGYQEIVQRSPGRWDVPISLLEFGINRDPPPWWPLVTEVLGDDAEHSFSGVVLSEPNSESQRWHIDSPHESATHCNAHALNVFVALHDLTLDMGPTEFVHSSHVFTNHLRNPALEVNKLLYQHDDTSPDLLRSFSRAEKLACVTLPMQAGSCVVFDDRMMHRGLANRSERTRYVAYFSYRLKGYRTNTHFEATRSIYSQS